MAGHWNPWLKIIKYRKMRNSNSANSEGKQYVNFYFDWLTWNLKICRNWSWITNPRKKISSIISNWGEINTLGSNIFYVVSEWKINRYNIQHLYVFLMYINYYLIKNDIFLWNLRYFLFHNFTHLQNPRSRLKPKDKF